MLCQVATLGFAFMDYPIARAPGMGLNAYFTFTVVKVMGIHWKVTLDAILLPGVRFIAASLFKGRDAQIEAIPKSR